VGSLSATLTQSSTVAFARGQRPVLFHILAETECACGDYHEEVTGLIVRNIGKSPVGNAMPIQCVLAEPSPNSHIASTISHPMPPRLIANLPSSLIGLEACAGSHFLGTVLREQRHQVRLIPAQFVKPYWKSNKNDFLDAEAIAEAVTKQNMRFVQIKTLTSGILSLRF
jgi:hypothetical protein